MYNTVTAGVYSTCERVYHTRRTSPLRLTCLIQIKLQRSGTTCPLILIINAFEDVICINLPKKHYTKKRNYCIHLTGTVRVVLHCTSHSAARWVKLVSFQWCITYNNTQCSLLVLLSPVSDSANRQPSSDLGSALLSSSKP